MFYVQRTIIAALILVGCSVIPAKSRAADLVALVIGNADYISVGRLDNPLNDAASVSEALREHGFDVVTATDLDLSAMLATLRDFRSKSDAADIALVYYAGHGIEVGGVNYLIPVDAKLADERDAPVQTITVETVIDQVSGARKLKMVVLDACRDNPFAAQMVRAGRGRNVGRGLRKVEVGRSDTLIAYAAAAGEVTPDGDPGENSPFSAAFVEALKGPPSDVRRLLGAVRDIMRTTVPGAEPFVYNSLGGSEYVINPGGAEPTSPPTTTAPALPGTADIREAQTLLSNLGLNPGAVDGRAGSRTKAALETFQRDYGLPATGIADPTTIVALRAAVRASALPSDRHSESRNGRTPPEGDLADSREAWLTGDYATALRLYRETAGAHPENDETRKAAARSRWLGPVEGRILFADDFEDPSVDNGSRWRSEPGWPVVGGGFDRVSENGGHILQGRLHYHAFPRIEQVAKGPYEIRIRARSAPGERGDAHINVTMPEGGGRVTIGLYFSRGVFSVWEDKDGRQIGSKDISDPGSGWRDLRIVVSGQEIELFLDGKSRLSYTSPRSRRISSDGFNLEVLNGEVQFDDVLIFELQS